MENWQKGQFAELSRKVFLDLHAPKPPSPWLAPVETKSSRPTGLFQETMNGDLSVLYQDMLNRPDQYDQETIRLVEELISTNRPILDTERQMLDLAVYDFNNRTKTPPPKPKPLPQTQIRQPSAPPPIPQPVVPPTADLGPKNEDIPQAFWWLRSK